MDGWIDGFMTYIFLGLKINETKRGKHIHIPKDLFEKGCVHTVQQGLKV